MENRHKGHLGLLEKCFSFRQTIKASTSEILKDLLQINEDEKLVKRQRFENEGKKNRCVKGKKEKRRVSEDVGAVLGLATLINEMHDFGGVRKKCGKSEKSATKGFLKFTRAGTHLAIAVFIQRKMGGDVGSVK